MRLLNVLDLSLNYNHQQNVCAPTHRHFCYKILIKPIEK